MGNYDTQPVAPRSPQPAETPIEKGHVSNGSSTYEQHNAGQRKKHRCRKFSKAPIWIEATCAVALVCITAFYTHYAYQQVEQMIAANKTAHDSIESSKAHSRLDQRAWLGIQSVAMPLTPKQPLRVDVVFTNSGKTPAINTYMQNSAGPELKSIPSLCADALRKKEAKILVTPNAQMIVSIEVSKQPPEVWESRPSPEQTIYSYGCMVYDDIFTDPGWVHQHWLTHCQRASSAQIRPGASAVAFVQCATGNDTGDGPPPTE